MKISELQLFLSQIANFVEATGASKLAVLNQTVECLEPFKTRELADFNQFLRMADEYVRTGVLPESTKPKKTRVPKDPKEPKAKKPAKLTVAEAAQIFLSLNERASDPTLEFSTIDAEISKFSDLTIGQLKEVAKEVNRTMPSSLKKPERVAAFKQMLKDQKENVDRNKPRTPEPAPQGAS
jgi:hypothetical protein